jgi:hypothetical protein
MTTENTLNEYDDDTLAEMADGFRAEADRLSRLARGALEELRARLVDRGATKLDTEHWEGALKPGAINLTVDDIERFRDRLDHADNHVLSLQQWAGAFVQPPAPPLRVDHRVLNELHKLGGEVAAIIDEERKSMRGDPTLVLTRKEIAE